VAGNHRRTLPLMWLERLSVTTRIGPRGLARATWASGPIQPSLLRDGVQKVISVPSGPSMLVLNTTAVVHETHTNSQPSFKIGPPASRRRLACIRG
jgi:hypothetical protein